MTRLGDLALLGDLPPALGLVVEEGRSSLPFLLLHGEALVACAAWGLGASGVTQVDLGTTWAALADEGQPLVLHDSLCPMTPSVFIAECVVRSVARDTVVAGVRPVTDTVKVVSHGVVGETVDRDLLTTVASPIVLPAPVVAALDGLPSLDFAELTRQLASRFEVEYVEAPVSARRVMSADDVTLLAALTQPLR